MKINEMLTDITQKLKLVNVGVIKPETIDENKIEDLRDLHRMVMKRESFSPSEMQAITEELGSLRKESGTVE